MSVPCEGKAPSEWEEVWKLSVADDLIGVFGMCFFLRYKKHINPTSIPWDWVYLPRLG